MTAQVGKIPRKGLSPDFRDAVGYDAEFCRIDNGLPGEELAACEFRDEGDTVDVPVEPSVDPPPLAAAHEVAGQDDAGPDPESPAQQAGVGRRERILEVVDMDRVRAVFHDQVCEHEGREHVGHSFHRQRMVGCAERCDALSDDGARARDQHHAPRVGQQAAREVVDELFSAAPRGGREHLNDRSGILHETKIRKKSMRQAALEACFPSSQGEQDDDGRTQGVPTVEVEHQQLSAREVLAQFCAMARYLRTQLSRIGVVAPPGVAAAADVADVPPQGVDQPVEVCGGACEALGVAAEDVGDRVGILPAVFERDAAVDFRPGPLEVVVPCVVGEPDSRTAAADLDVHQRVLPAPHGVVAQGVVEKRASVKLAPQRRRDSEGHHFAQVSERLQVGGLLFTHDRPVGCADADVVAAYDVVSAVLRDGREQRLQHVLLPPVVPVEEADVAAPGLCKGRFAGARHPLIPGRHHDETVVSGRQPPDFGERSVGRSVVHDDGLEASPYGAYNPSLFAQMPAGTNLGFNDLYVSPYPDMIF